MPSLYKQKLIKVIKNGETERKKERQKEKRKK
jgi:hypothetical protein